MLRRTLMVSMVGASVLGLAACGGTTPPESRAEPSGASAEPYEVVALALEATASEQMKVVLEIPLALPSGELLLRAAGPWDLSAGVGELAIDPETYAALRDARVSAFVWDRLIVDGGSWYTHHPDLDTFLVPGFSKGRRWVRWSEQRPLYGLPDPAEALGWVRDRPATGENAGTEQHAGAEARRYRVVFDPATFEAGASNLESAVVDVWVGADGRIVKLAAELEYDQGPGQAPHIDRGMYTFSEPGIAVDVELPPEADTIAEQELGESATEPAETLG